MIQRLRLFLFWIVQGWLDRLADVTTPEEKQHIQQMRHEAQERQRK